MFEWRWFERGASADAGLSQRFARLCPTPEDRSHMFELEAKAQKVQELRSRHGMASSDNDTDGEGEDRSSPDLGQTRALLFERKRADAELEAGRVRLDDMQRQFRSFLETNCHVLEQTEWMVSDMLACCFFFFFRRPPISVPGVSRRSALYQGDRKPWTSKRETARNVKRHACDL